VPESPVQPERPRPSFHVTPRRGWLNDPLGLTWHGGRYHLFYQYLPGLPEWNLACQWGHVTSPDLLHWTELPVALAPGEGDDGCWSGSVVIPPDGGAATMFYTSVRTPDLDRGRARVARPLDDGWVSWAKGDVVAVAPDDGPVIVFRDPFVFRDGAVWRMLVGGAYAGGTAVAFAFTSTDLAAWAYDGPLLTRSTVETDGAWTGAGWECPQLIAVGDQHVLLVSVWEPDGLHHVAAAIGSYTEGRFTARRWQQLTSAPGHYAGSVFTDREGTPGVIFWIRGTGDGERGWMGALSVPYVIATEGDGVRLDPHPAVAGLRVPSGSGTHGALDVEWFPDRAGVDALELRDDAGRAVATLTAGPGWVDVVAGSAAPIRVPRGLAPVRVIVDGSILEVSTGSGLAGASIAPSEAGLRCEPASADGLNWWALAPGNAAELGGAPSPDR